MAVGKVSSSILTDIANAIRAQNGTATLYKPSQMAAAVLALDGEQEGEAGVEEYKAPVEGVLSSKVFSAIADAIRLQNGQLAAVYLPREMAPAIAALEWDVGLKPRAVLLADGTLEFNYLERRRSATSSERVVTAWETATGGYASAAARPWDARKGEVTAVVFDASFAAAGVTSAAFWFTGFTALEEVRGFECLSGITDATQLFSSCSQLRSVYATGFDYSSIKKYSAMFFGTSRLVGGTDGFVPTSSSDAWVCKVGKDGALTDPANDTRTWFTGTVFADGELSLSVEGADAAGREVLASGLVCANARYNAIQSNPWADHAKTIERVSIAPDMATLPAVNMNYWFYGFGALTSVDGMGHLRGVSMMRFTFNSCTALVELDMRGMDPGSLSSLNYLFGACAALRTVLVDPDWELPSGVAGMGTFYNCKSIVGGNGTTFNSSKTGYAMMRVDTEGVAGYLTAG